MMRKPGGQRKHRTGVDVAKLCMWTAKILEREPTKPEPRKPRRKPQIECLRGALIVSANRFYRPRMQRAA